MHTATKTLAAAALIATLAACSESPSAEAEPINDTSWLAASAPAGAISVTEAKATAAEGDQIVITGTIGGRAAPITAHSPVFLIMDNALPSCADKANDHCPMPWDYCCETPESRTANAATIQIVGANTNTTGQAITVDPISAGLKPLDIVTITGTVGPRPSPEVLTIKATQVHVTPN